MTQAVCRKLTTVLFVPTIAPSLDFWRDRLGFAVINEVPGEDGPVFAILDNGTIELMLQTVASLTTDPHASHVGWHEDRSFLFVEVDDIDATATALDGCEVVVPRHATFYGAIEIAYRAPGGHIVTFAQFAH